nr:ABC transporter permease subunit [uncultured Devosia sp.]
MVALNELSSGDFRPAGRRWIGHGTLFGLAGLAILIVSLLGHALLPEAFYNWPASSKIPLQSAADAWLDQLLKQTEIFGEPMRKWTRSYSEILGVPMRFVQSLLASGWSIADNQTGAVTRIPPVPWLAVSVGTACLAWLVAGRRLGLFALATFAYFAVFGLWNEAMLTLASVSVTITVGMAVGIALGVVLWRFPGLQVVANPIFDVMQTIPPFSYLVPVLVLFGFGPVAALVATLIFALPPMVRATVYALGRVPNSVVELADMTGANFFQRLFKVFMSTARADILLGLNQLVMMSLAMVILASMIGAGGLGSEVLKALQSLRLGRGVEAGLAITFMAIVLYNLGHAYATRRPSHKTVKPGLRPGYLLILAIGISFGLGLTFPQLSQYPQEWTVSSSDFWSRGVAWLNMTYGHAFEAIRTTITFSVLRPLLALLQGVGWLGWLLALVAVSLALGRPLLAVTTAAIVLAIASIGYWDLTMITLHLVFAGTLLSLIIGVPVGIWAAYSPRAGSITNGVVTTLQTLPSFVYLIPTVMLLGPGDVAGVFAIAMYSMATTIRYVSHALSHVDKGVIEASDMFGANFWQTLFKVRLPLAWPGMLLALNQTLMMAVGMVVITSLIGTRGLELETIEAIARVQPGRSLVAGLTISALAIMIDRLLNAAATRQMAPAKKTAL